MNDENQMPNVEKHITFDIWASIFVIHHLVFVICHSFVI